MKSVLLSIKPPHCGNIASGQKTVEIRKNCPKIDVPFKCYIYETLSGGKGRGKVIGEFVCDKIDEFYPTMDLRELNTYHVNIVEKSCVDMADLFTYAGGKQIYAWHISNLVIYDKPKELSEFHFPPNKYCKKGMCGGCLHDYTADVYGDYDYDCEWKRPILRPPQSWCYVEELEGQR